MEQITKGTENQIKWAEGIRNEVIEYFDDKIKKMSERKPKVAKAYEVRKNNILNHEQADNAMFWIKNQDWMKGRNIDVNDFV